MFWKKSVFQPRREACSTIIVFIRKTFVHVDDGCTTTCADRQARASTEPAAVAASLADYSDSEDEADEGRKEQVEESEEEDMPVMAKT